MAVTKFSTLPWKVLLMCLVCKPRKLVIHYLQLAGSRSQSVLWLTQILVSNSPAQTGTVSATGASEAV